MRHPDPAAGRAGAGRPTAPTAVAVLVALAALIAASCGGGDDTMDMDAQRTLLEQGLEAAAEPFATEVPPIEAKRCDDPVDRDRRQWQAGGQVDVDEAGVDGLLDEVAAAWDELGISSERSTVQGAEPALRGEHGDVTLAVTASAPFGGGRVRIDIAGSTGCGDI